MKNRFINHRIKLLVVFSIILSYFQSVNAKPTTTIISTIDPNYTQHLCIRPGDVRVVQWSANSDQIAIASTGKIIILGQNFIPVSQIPIASNLYGHSLSWSPDGSRLAVELVEAQNPLTPSIEVWQVHPTTTLLYRLDIGSSGLFDYSGTMES
jgi:hypothetical protein